MAKKILIIGSGAREHALAVKLAQSPKVDKVYALPGNAGMTEVAICHPIKVTDHTGIINFAKQEAVDLVVIGPEGPLVKGLANDLSDEGIMVFGPDLKSALLEGSKRLAKAFMREYNIPTADYKSFENYEDAKKYIEGLPNEPIVIKASGLAVGKGVIIANNRAEALKTIEMIMKNKAFGDAGNEVVIEELLTGEEVSLLTFFDGKHIVPMLPVQDHKQVGVGDTGLNTGGMGAYAPTSVYTSSIEQQVNEQIIEPLKKGLVKEELNYCGCLYIGLMLTASGPKVIEFNVRFGDPEAEVLMPLLQSDLYDIMIACCQGTLHEQSIVWKPETAVCVVLASGGYPGHYETDYIITDYEALEVEKVLDTWVFHAGTKRNAQGKLVTAGGRVIAVTAISKTFQDAQKAAYDRLHQISFKNCYFRSDIGYKELARHNGR